MLPKQLRFLHPYLHYLGLLLMVAGLPFSVFLMSLSSFFIGGNLLLEARLKENWQRFVSNPAAWLLCGIFLMLIPSLLWTTAIDQGIRELRINLPFLIFPFVLAASPPLKESWYRLLIKLFILAVFLATIVCSILRLPDWLNGSLSDIRQISVFISHIRFAMMIVLSILLIGWILLRDGFPTRAWEKVLGVVIAAWMFTFLLILQSLTGLFAIMLIGGIYLLYLGWKTFSGGLLLAIYSIPVIVFSITGYVAYQAYLEYSEPNAQYTKPLELQTKSGNLYTHDFGLIENGYYVNSYVNEQELREAWQTRSSFSIDSSDNKGNSTYSTLIRFLNSKGLRKDKEGVMALSDKEIRHIHQGIANVKYTGLWGIRMRFYQLLWELDFQKQGRANASGHTVMMKLEFWKNSLKIIKQNPILGTGIGDVPQEFKAEYVRSDSWLNPQWWMTSHNQFLYIAVGTGIPGLILFIYLFFKPATLGRQRNYPPFQFFFAIAVISMFTEDTLTTQAGVSFVAFFYCVFLFSRPSENSKEISTV